MKDYYKFFLNNETIILDDFQQEYNKSFNQISECEYKEFLSQKDFTKDNDLITWSILTNIPIVALTKDSDFFYHNLHLLPEGKLIYSSIYDVEDSYHQDNNTITFSNSKTGDSYSVTLADDVLTKIDNKINGHKRIGVNNNFKLDVINYDILDPFLTEFSNISNRQEISEAIKLLPLSIVKYLTGKAIYLSTESGRSYAISQSVSNDAYIYFAGMIPGSFFETNTARQTPDTFIHELGHIIDSTLIKKGYGHILYSYQSENLSSLKDERKLVFSEGLKNKEKGYISHYSKTNAAEDFAEHFMYHIRYNDKFKDLADSQLKEGSDVLMNKYNFMEKLINYIVPDVHSLSIENFVEIYNMYLSKDSDGDRQDQTEEFIKEKYFDAEYMDSKTHSNSIKDSIGIELSCKVGELKKVDTSPEGYKYFYNRVTCNLTKEVSPAQIQELESEGWYNYYDTVLRDRSSTVFLEEVNEYIELVGSVGEIE
jgi:hypothetical protein